MHEMAITRSLLEIIGSEMKKRRFKRLKSVKIRVGELTAIEPEALRFCFEASIAGTGMQGAVLKIENVELKGRCRACKKRFHVKGRSFVCPACGSTEINLLGGAGLDVVSMEAD